MKTELAPGVHYWPCYIGGPSQQILVDEVLRLLLKHLFTGHGCREPVTSSQ
jgi:hypothetical protein